MKRYLLSACTAVGCMGLAAWLEPTATVRGWCRGDTFYAQRSATYWAARLGDSDPVSHTGALEKLRGGGADALPVLLQVFKQPPSPDASDLRCRAAELIGELGEGGKQAVPDLTAALGDQDEYVRTITVRTLGKVAPAQRDVVAALLPQLDGPLRPEVLMVLKRSGVAALPALPVLVDILQDGRTPADRGLAGAVLGKIGAKARPAVQPLRSALHDDDPVVRLEAAEALGFIGHDGDGVVAALEAVLGDTDSRVRFQSVRALGKLGPRAQAALPAVRRLLTDEDAKVREAAKQAVGRLSPPGALGAR